MTPSSRFGNCRSVTPIAHLNEQALVAHAGQMAARNANLGQLFRPDYPIVHGKCDRAFSEGQLRTAGQPNSLGSVAISLANLEGVLWRSFEGNRQHKVRRYVQPGRRRSSPQKAGSGSEWPSTSPAATLTVCAK